LETDNDHYSHSILLHSFILPPSLFLSLSLSIRRNLVRAIFFIINITTCYSFKYNYRYLVSKTNELLF